jgi:hypothetical protein
VADIINPIPEILSGPVPDDPDEAQDILAELQAVLKRRGCVLMVSPPGKPHEMILCKVTSPEILKARVMAGIKDIGPYAITWRRIGERREEKAN